MVGYWHRLMPFSAGFTPIRLDKWYNTSSQ
jgi:hypothetical protein